MADVEGGDYFDSSALYAVMFAEDVRLGVLPYDRGAVELVNRTRESGATVARLLARFTQSIGDPRAAIDGWIRFSASELARRGEVWFELVGRDSPEPKLVPISAGRVVAIGASALQIVKPRPSLQRSARRALAWLPANTIVRVRLPAALGNARSQRGLLRVLDTATSLVKLPEWGMQNTQYDFSSHRRIVEMGLARATRRWGWNGRGSWTESFLENYEIRRYIRFQLALASLRIELSRALNRVFADLRTEIRVTLNGKHQVSELAALLNKLESGQIDNTKLVDELFHKG